MPNHYFVGLLLGSASCIGSSLGETWQRLSRLNAEKLSTLAPPWRRPMWLGGTLLVLVSSPLDAASFLYTPMSTLIVLDAMKQPLLAVMACLMLKERISRLCVLGIVSVACGTTLSLLFAPQPTKLELSAPMDFFTAAITWYLLLSALSCAALGAWIFLNPSQAQAGSLAPRDFARPLLTAWCLGMERLFNVGMGGVPAGASWWNLRWMWMPMAVVGLAVVTFCLTVGGLERMSTHIFLPMRFGCTALITGVQSMLFGEFAGISQSGFLWWCLGLLAAISGTMFVALASASVEQRAAVETRLRAKFCRLSKRGPGSKRGSIFVKSEASGGQSSKDCV